MIYSVRAVPDRADPLIKILLILIGAATVNQGILKATLGIKSLYDEAEMERSGSLDGRTGYVVNDPLQPGRTITDIDRIEGNVLWEEKSTIYANNVTQWIGKHITSKFNSYLDARQYIAGYQDAEIGFDFISLGIDPSLKIAVEAEITRLKSCYPHVKIRLRWR